MLNFLHQLVTNSIFIRALWKLLLTQAWWKLCDWPVRQNYKLKEAKNNQSRMIILCKFITVSDPYHIPHTHFILSDILMSNSNHGTKVRWTPLNRLKAVTVNWPQISFSPSNQTAAAHIFLHINLLHSVSLDDFPFGSSSPLPPLFLPPPPLPLRH